MPVRTGAEYLEQINRLKANVWINGEVIEGEISEHPAFEGVMNSQASLYDLQHDPEKKKILTYSSPSSGEPVGVSFMEPKTKEDLEWRRTMTQEWAKVHAGMMGRSPDYMNTVLMAYQASADIFGGSDKRCADNIRNFYLYCRENDLCMTHTFITPQVNRSRFYFDNSDDIVAAKMIDKNADGIVIQGARLLATQGGITDELLVLPPSGVPICDAYAYAFSIPTNTPGMKFICRESFNYKKSHFDHPLSSRFEEMDAIVVFDNVTVPWDRVFLYEDTDSFHKLHKESNYFTHTTHQCISRAVVKIEFILGVIQLLVDTINIKEYQHVKEKVSEVIVALETLKSFVIASEAGAQIDRWGTMSPDRNPLLAAIHYFPRIYPTFSEIIQSLGASGLVALPKEVDFASDIRPDLDRYLQAARADALDRVKLFRLAWDLCMSAFGTRQTLYEKFFFGDPIRVSERVYREYSRDAYTDTVKHFLQN